MTTASALGLLVAILLKVLGMSKSVRVVSCINGVSDRALSRILARVKNDPSLLDGPSSRATLSRHAFAAAQDVGVVEHTLALSKGPPQQWKVLTLQDLLPYLCNCCPHFRQVLADVYSQCGADWHIVLYCDGLTPGAVLAPENNRKSVIWYATLLELGPKLCHEELWCTLASIETSVSKLVPAQLASLTRLIVRDMLVGPRAVNTAGIILPVGPNGRHELIRLHYQATLADEEALSSMLGLKGSGGISPCALRCWCVNKERKADQENGILSLTDRGGPLVDVTCCRKGDIVLKRDQDVYDDCAFLELHAADENFKELESCVGINFHADGILFARELRPGFKPSSRHRYDPLHVIFSNGLLPAEIMLFMKEARQQTGKYFGDFRAYAAEGMGWQCAGKAKVLAAVSPHREKASDASLKAGASELLAAYPVLRQWALKEFRGIPAMRAPLRSLLLLLDVADIVVEAATCPPLQDAAVMDLAARLDTAAFLYLEAFVNAYGRELMKHKHHELIHLAAQLRRDKRLLWCFTAERKHIIAKAVMAHSQNLRAFAYGAVARMLMSQIDALLDTPPWHSRLLDPAWDFDELAPGARMSRAMQLHGCRVACGTPVFLDRDRTFLILVVACVAVGDRFGILGHQCVAARRDAYSSEWDVQPAIGHRFLEPAGVLEVARHWRFSACRNRLTALH